MTLLKDYLAQSGGAARGDSGINDPFGGGGSGGGPRSVSAPVATGAGSGATPGTYNINPVNPIETFTKATAETGNFVSGLSRILFGQTEEDVNGSHGGLLGDVPVIGQGGRFVDEVGRNVGGVVAGVGSGAVDVVGGALERIPALDPFNMAASVAGREQLERDFMALPDSDPDKQRVLAQIEAEKNDGIIGLINKGGGDAKWSYMAGALNAAQERRVAAAQEKPDLWAGLGRRSASFGQHLENVVNLSTAVPQRLGERALAGAGLGIGDGQSRYQEIMGVAAGDREFSTAIEGSHTAMTPVEQTVVNNVRAGKWTENEALDYLASHGAGLSHDVATQIALSVVTDPLTLLATAASGGAALGVKSAQILKFSGDAAKALDAANDALRAGRAAADATVALQKTATGRYTAAAKRARAAIKELPSLEAAAKEAEEVAQAASTGRLAVAGQYRKLDPRKALYETDRGSALVKAVSTPYVAAQGTSVARTAKIIRTIVDPLHAVQRAPATAKTYDLYSGIVADRLINSYGRVGDMKLRFAIREMGGDYLGRYEQAWAGASNHAGMQVVGESMRASAIKSGLAARLVKDPQGPNGVIAAVMSDRPEAILDSIVEQGNRLRRRKWGKEEMDNLHQRLMVGIFKGADPEDVWNIIRKSSADQRSQLHYASFSKFATDLELAKAAVLAAGKTEGIFGKVGKFFVMNRKTLTKQGAAGILKDFDAATTVASKMSFIKSRIALYPELGNFVVDDARAERTIERFGKYVEEAQRRLPSQVLNDELAELADSHLMDDVLDQMDETFTLGIAPDDKYAWGMERINKQGGGYGVVGDIRTGAASMPIPEYSPMHHVEVNILGQALPTSTKVDKAVSYMDAMQKVMRQRVSGLAVVEAAGTKFVNQLHERHGFTEAEGNEMWEGLMAMTRAGDWVINPRGFTEKSLWTGLDEFIPTRMRTGPVEGQFTKRDLLATVLDAYDGDVRFIGVTQKFTGRVKAVLGPHTGNAPALIAENLYPNIKFRLNIMFQSQERIEPGVLSAMRGVWSVGRTLNATDQSTQRLLDRMTATSATRAADVEISELSEAILGSTKDAALRGRSRFSDFMQRTEGLTDRQGAKRLASIRTFRKGLGRELRPVWEQHSPGTWDDMKQAASFRHRRLLDDDEFAVELLLEHQLANDIIVPRALKFGEANALGADFRAAVQLGQWMTPVDLGGLRKLGLDDVAEFMGFPMPGGLKTRTAADLRSVLANGKLDMEDVRSTLLAHGADPDYVRRVEHSLDFSWEGFWQEVSKRYNLTKPESEQLQDMVGGAAELRGMTPVDYISQVFSPTIQNGTEGAVGAMGGHVALLRGQTPGSAGADGLAYLAAKVDEGGQYLGTREELVNQLSRVFAQHLDPSAKRALLIEFRPELRRAVSRGDVRFDLDELMAMWDEDAENDLANRILGFMDGRPGSGQFDEVLDPSIGSQRARDMADDFLASQGRAPRTAGRRVFREDTDLTHRRETAYDDLEEVDYDLTGRVVKTKQLAEADDATLTKLKGAKVDKRTKSAYQDYLNETLSQFRRMTTGKTGIKVTVVKTEQPYATVQDMVADIDKGRLKVYGGQSDHPLLTNEQVVMQRAVQDFYGFAAEGFDFNTTEGITNAMAHSATAYSDTARAVHFTEMTQPATPPPVATAAADWSLLDRTDPSWDARPSTKEEFFAKHGDLVDASTPNTKPVPLPEPPGGWDPDYPMEWRFEEVEVPANARFVTQVNGHDVGGRKVKVTITANSRFGPGFDKLSFAEQEEVIKTLDWWIDTFGEGAPKHLDILPLDQPLAAGGLNRNLNGIAWGSNEDQGVVLLNSNMFGEEGVRNARSQNAFQAQSRLMTHFNRPVRIEDVKEAGTDLEVAKLEYQTAQRAAIRGNLEADELVPIKVRVNNAEWKFKTLKQAFDSGEDANLPRLSEMGVAFKSEDEGWRGTFVHEMAHSFDVRMRYGAHSYEPVNRPYKDFVRRFQQAESRKLLSEYGMTNDEEMMAELLRIAVRKDLDLGDLDPALADWVTEVRDMLKANGYVNLSTGALTPAPLKRKVGILPQDVLDDIHTTYIGNGRHAESNPDVARTAQMFSKWTQRVVGRGLDGPGALPNNLSGVLHDIAGMPTEAGVPYNLTEHRLLQAAEDAMDEKWQDTHRLQYFKKRRTMFERSINHPMFGVYPASYMWGKMLPELARFIALEPFGVKTGAMAYAMRDVQKQVAIQREYDPAFDARIEELGHSQALWMLSYMLPAVPWDISAALPTWLRDLSQQGLDNEARVESGGEAEGLDIVKPLGKVADQFNPFKSFKQVQSVDRELQENQSEDEGQDLGEALDQAMRDLQAALSQ